MPLLNPHVCMHACMHVCLCMPVCMCDGRYISWRFSRTLFAPARWPLPDILSRTVYNAKGTRAHTHRELIPEWLWEPKGNSLEYI